MLSKKNSNPKFPFNYFLNLGMPNFHFCLTLRENAQQCAKFK
jgi:hypothetical protein